jgi:hypothetical protein
MKSKPFNLTVIMLIACFLGIFSACSTQNNEAFAESATFELDTYCARVGDVIGFEDNAFNVYPSTCEHKCTFSSSNSQIAQVDAITGEIVCLNEGTVIIYGKVIIADNKFVGDTFTLTIAEALIYATDFTLQNEGELTVGFNAEPVINSLNIEGINVNVLPSVSYSSGGIVSYDYASGQINTLGLGSTTVFVTMELNSGEQLTKQFEVHVVEQILYIDAQTTYEKVKDEVFYIYFEIIDNTKESNLATTQQVEVQILTTNNLIEIITVDYQTILVKTLNTSGTALIRLTYVEDDTVTKDIGIVIN